MVLSTVFIWKLPKRILCILQSIRVTRNLLTDKKYYESIKTSCSFAAAGDILAEVWSESAIDSYPVVGAFLSPPENICEAMIFTEGEEWKAKHVMQVQYKLQIVRCNDNTCCDKWRTNYSEFFLRRYVFWTLFCRDRWEKLEL